MTSISGHNIRPDLLLLFFADALLVSAMIGLLLLWQGDVPVETGSALAVTIAAFCGLLSGASGLYQPEALAVARRLLLGTVVASLLLLLLLLPLLLFLLPAPPVGVSLYVQLFGITLAFVVAVMTTRLCFTMVLRRGRLNRQVAMVRGEAGNEPQVLNLLRDRGYKIALDAGSGSSVARALNPAELRTSAIRAIILADGAEVSAGIRAGAESVGIPVLTEDEFLEREFARVDIERLPQGWLARSNARREARFEAVLRRLLDIVLGVVLIVATLPLLLITALAIKLDGPGPIFYRQERVGLGGRTFMLFKFRSMVVDAEKGGAPIWASKRDARVTRVGRFLRLTRIDEIPQVLNLLLGDMAFVGPRPERPAFVRQLREIIPHYADRDIVKPGITGWAQVNYPYGASVEDARKKLAYDLYYVRRRSLFLDLLILVATVRVVLFQEGSR
ncbi:exopolysaccharide biosynthesis polyprenyl glycosylphosphotransferase [Roseomonas sp. WA12]